LARAWNQQFIRNQKDNWQPEQSCIRSSLLRMPELYHATPGQHLWRYAGGLP